MFSSALFSSAPAMQSVLHLLNIGTLATWLSVAGLGTVAVIAPQWEHAMPELAVIEETQLVDEDFSIGDVGPADGGGEISDSAAGEFSETIPVEALPAPPELQPLADLAPLPEIPALPAAAAKPVETRNASAGPTRQVTSRPGSRAANSGSSSRSGGTSGQTGNGSSSGTGISESARLAAGRMPAPSYPAECRRKGQSGTVVVEFIVDTSGRVISAYAKSESPWPLLNNEAVRTVRKWKFPPGGIMKLQRPIVFQLR
jgi:TonB family protein